MGFCFRQEAWDLRSPTGPWAVKGPSLNHWITKEFPRWAFLCRKQSDVWGDSGHCGPGLPCLAPLLAMLGPRLQVLSSGPLYLTRNPSTLPVYLLVCANSGSPCLLSLWFIDVFIFKVFYLYFNWRIITLQNFVVFCQTSTWISHMYTHIPSFLNPLTISLPGMQFFNF